MAGEIFFCFNVIVLSGKQTVADYVSLSRYA
jgi:hypothetical protein